MNTKKITLANIGKSIILPIAIYLTMFIGTGGRFGQPASLLLVFRQSVIPILIAMAIGCNMTIGMWDLSAGAVMFASAMIGGSLAQLTGTGVAGMVAFCTAIAIGLTALSGALYRLMKVPANVLTVGLVMIYEALPRLLQITVVKVNLEEAILSQSPWCFVILAIMGVVFYIIFNLTPFGHNVKAIGANQKIARSAGINIEKTKHMSFLLSGLFIGIASALYLSNITVMRPPAMFASVNLIFDAMMGIFIAFFLERYCNFTFGIVIGTVSMQLLISGLVSLGLDTTSRMITQGIFLLILLAFSSNQGRFDEARTRKRLIKEADQNYVVMMKSQAVPKE